MLVELERPMRAVTDQDYLRVAYRSARAASADDSRTLGDLTYRWRT